MEALYVLLIFSLLLGGTFLMAFFWAQGNGQFEDSETPALRILFDDHDLKAQKAKAILTNLDNSMKTDAGKTPATKTPDASALQGVGPAKSNIQGAHYGS